MSGDQGNDWLYGDTAGDAIARSGERVFGGNDTLIGGRGDDQMWGDFGGSVITGDGGIIEGGDDIFVFGPGDGHDVIHDFEAGVGVGDRLDVRDLRFSCEQEVIDRASDDGFGNTVIDLGRGTEVTLIDVEAADLAADDIWIT